MAVGFKLPMDVMTALIAKCLRPGQCNMVALGQAAIKDNTLVWAIEGDWNPADLQSNTFEMEWPPRSGRRQLFHEIDRAAWFQVDEARKRILKGQALFIDRLFEAVRQ